MGDELSEKTRSASVREAYELAVNFFVQAAALVGSERWDAPALGEWSVRDLVGHTTRALLTVEAYLGQPADRVDVVSTLDYFLGAGQATGGSAEVARRGKLAGEVLGPDPARAVEDIAGRVLALIRTVPDDALVGTPVGGMRLVDYLPTRTFELVVHTLDLAAALGVDAQPPERALDAALEITVTLAARRGRGPVALLALTGRRPLPAGFSVLSRS